MSKGVGMSTPEIYGIHFRQMGSMHHYWNAYLFVDKSAIFVPSQLNYSDLLNLLMNLHNSFLAQNS